MPTLVLVRHAHAATGADDRARRLDARGRDEATSVRRWLADQGLVPDRVVVSPAVRTRETWELASVGAAEVRYDERVYEASVQELLSVVAETPASVGTLVLVGHNPAVEQLAWSLDDSPAAREQTDRGMRPAAVAAFFLDTWGAASGQLVAATG